MSDINLAIAGTVAQGSLQAQQASRALHRRRTDTTAEAKRLREGIDAHLAAVDEGDEANLISQLRIDEQLPGHENPPQDQHHSEKPPTAAASDDSTDSADANDAAKVPNDSSYRALDVTA